MRHAEYCCPAGAAGTVPPTQTNVQAGSQVTLVSSKAAFENAFSGKSYVWHPAMEKLLGQTVTVVSTGSSWSGPTFGLPRSDPNHPQAVWLYPLSVIARVECVDEEPTTTTTTTECKCPSLCETCDGVCNCQARDPNP